jgi:hypothetical protein
VAACLALGGLTGVAAAGTTSTGTSTGTSSGAGRAAVTVRSGDVAAAGSERSAPVTVLLVGLGATVGVLVGLLPAFIAALLLGRVGPLRWGRGAEPALAEPGRAPPAAPAASVTPPPPPAPAVATDDPAAPPVAVLAHARHQAVYDAAYAEQSERVAELRATIGTRLRHRRSTD